MKVEIVEIGTSDFRTEAGKKKGLFVEPIKEYYDRLPKCLKENVAVSNNEGSVDIYYIPSEKIKSLGLPDWLRGCNSINEPHKTIVDMGWLGHLEIDSVPVVRIKTLFDKHNITDIELLKIDTEGHDCVILNDFLDTCTIRPKVIQFESNSLSNHHDIYEVCKRLQLIGYKCSQVKFDMICVL
jgi:FkbM family methyltransferase